MAVSGIARKSLKKAFGFLPVRKGILLDVRDGELVTPFGPSGCGKMVLSCTIPGLP